MTHLEQLAAELAEKQMEALAAVHNWRLGVVLHKHERRSLSLTNKCRRVVKK